MKKSSIIIILSAILAVACAGAALSHRVSAIETFEQATVYDLSDLGDGMRSVGGAAEIGNFPGSENVAVNFNVKMSETEQTWENGLLFVPFSDNLWEDDRPSVQIAEGVIYMTHPNTHNVRVCEYTDSAITSGAVFNLEIGRVGILDSGRRVGWQIYVKYNGKQILAMREDTPPTAGKLWVYYGKTDPSILYGEDYFALETECSTAEMSDTVLKKGESLQYCFARPEWFYYQPISAVFRGKDILSLLEQAEQGVWRIPLVDPAPGDVLELEFRTEGYETRLDETQINDFYDASGNEELAFNVPETTYGLGVLSRNNNVAYKVKIDMPDAENFATPLRIVLGATDTWDMWQCGGYMLKIGDGWMNICSSMEDVVYDVAESSEFGHGKSFILEFGVAKFYVNDEYVANYIFARADGQLLLEYYDSARPQLGRAVIGMYLENVYDGLLFSSTKTIYEISLAQADGVDARSQTVEAGEIVTFALPVAEGYEAASLTVNGEDRLADLEKTYGGYRLDLGEIVRDTQIVFTVKPISADVMEG